MKQRNLIIGAAAAVLLVGAGVLGDRFLLSGTANHTSAPSEGAEAGPDEPGAEQGETSGPKKGEGHSRGEVTMDGDALAATGIGLEKLAPASLTSEIAAQATVKGAPDGEAMLTARVAGAITQIRKRLGDPVTRGETVAVVASSEAAALSAALASADARLDLARSSYEREKRLFEAKITSRQDLERAEAEFGEAQAEFKRSEAAVKAAGVSPEGASVSVASPIAGRITFASDMSKLGAFVSPEAVLFRVADPTRIQIEAAVPVTDARRITPGDPATVAGATGDEVGAAVRSVTPGVDADSRSATVVLALTGDLDGLQPGQFVRVRIRPRSTAPAEGRFVLPSEAVQAVDGRDVVFVRNGDKFIATSVRTGARSGGRIEILSGLTAGQTVAGKKAFLLKAELGKGEVEE